MINIIEIVKNENPFFLKTKTIKYSFAAEPNKILSWEILESHSTVHILVDNIETKEILLVKQPRIPVLLRDQSQLGLCVETCAGLIDKEGKNPFEIAKEEVEEELGYLVKESDLTLIKKAKSGLGSSGNDIFYFNVKVTEANKISNGGGIENENIEVFRLKYEDIGSFISSDIHTDSTTLFLLTNWLFNNRIAH